MNSLYLHPTPNNHVAAYYQEAYSSYLFYGLKSELSVPEKLLFFLFCDGICELLKAFIISSLTNSRQSTKSYHNRQVTPTFSDVQNFEVFLSLDKDRYPDDDYYIRSFGL